MSQRIFPDQLKLAAVKTGTSGIKKMKDMEVFYQTYQRFANLQYTNVSLMYQIVFSITYPTFVSLLIWKIPKRHCEKNIVENQIKFSIKNFAKQLY